MPIYFITVLFISETALFYLCEVSCYAGVKENKEVKLVVIVRGLKSTWVVTVLYGVAIEIQLND